MKFLSSVVFISLLSVCSIIAQTEKSYEKDFNKAEKTFFSLYQRSKADNLNYSKGEFSQLLPFLLDLYNLVPDNKNIAFKIGICYLNSSEERLLSISYLNTAATNVSENCKESSAKEKKAPIITLYYLGEAYRLNYQLDSAIKAYEKFISLSTKKLDVAKVAETKHRIEMCKVAKDMVAHPINVKIENLGDGINSSYADYSPILSADQNSLYFTSRRPFSTREKDVEGNYSEDIYLSHKTDKGWSDAENIGAPINTEGNEATVGLSPDGQTILIYKDDSGAGDLYTTTLNGDVWNTPEKLNKNINSEYWEPCAAISADGNMLYFSSNRPGGFGGRDLYTSKRTPNGEWAKPVNAGSIINTAYDEDAPFISVDDSTLIFSSNGHKTMGGFDIFTSKLSEKGTWLKPENVGYPINTIDHDIYFVLSPKGTVGYFSSFRKDGMGEKDNYKVTFIDRLETPITMLKGTVVDKSGKPMQKVEIIIVDRETEQVVGVYHANSLTGKYLFMLKPGGSYNITYKSDSMVFHTADIEIPKEADYHEIKQMILIDTIVDRKEYPVTVLNGAVTDKSGNPAQNVEITIADNETEEVLGVYHSNNTTGKYTFMLSPGKDYNITYQSDGYLFQSENMKIKRVKKPKVVEVKSQVVLDTVAADSKTTLKNIFFDFDETTLRPASNVEINNLIAIMNKYPKMKVEISGHTDNFGDDGYNQQLSEARAKAVVNRLIEKGISGDRIKAEGYGEKKPIARNTRANGKDNFKGRRLNRRVEFKIIEIE